MKRFAGFFVAALFCSRVVAQPLQVQVVDVGAGLCCVVVTPDGHYAVIDAGNYADRGATAMAALERLIPYGATIDLLVLSHCDADHIAAVPFIFENYAVREVWRDGFDNGSDTWRYADTAVRAEENCQDVNLQEIEVEPGYAITVGKATVTFLCGFSEIPESWEPLSKAENRNARSVVVRLDYDEASMFFSGDTVGRRTGDRADVCVAAEQFLVANASTVPIDVDVVVAPHHGGDNGSSTALIEAMSPRYVIFSAGSKYRHPRAQTVRRYLASGVPASRIFRTDRGDNEGSPEWRPRSGARPDPPGDDDVLVELSRNGRVDVSYARAAPESPIAQPEALPRIGLSPQIAKYVNDDSLWTETHDDLREDELDAVPKAHGASSTSCHRRPRFRLFRRWR